jgi:hypothetical protein
MNVGSPSLGPGNARNVAAKFAERLFIPASHPSGPCYQVVAFANEEDCRFFYPQRDLGWHCEFNAAIQRALHKRGISVQALIIAPWEYERWRELKLDTPEMRRSFADLQMRFFVPFKREKPAHAVSAPVLAVSS